MLLFKADFNKAFDTVNWEYLDHVQMQMGFGQRWRGWIQGCLRSSSALILVNGSPTDEFEFSRRIRQDDALFVGEWSEENIKNLARILRCFHVSSGLQVNFSKSRVFGIGVDHREVETLAKPLGCEPAKLPFTYLGVPIGANMKLLKNWKPVIEKLQARLSTWKSRSLSLGGRLTLAKAVLGSIPTFYFSLFVAPAGVIKTLEKIR
ncbi:uncharacterized protein LOC111921907 [Lactuca sativa]|nr:uncharacterized protein LOC111921907 [Lactuca sativa]